MVKQNRVKFAFQENRLKWTVLGVVFACIGVLTIFVSKAATPVASLEPETGTALKATLVNDPVASGSRAIKFNANVASSRGPLSFTSLNQAKTTLGAPTDANYVTWDPTWPVDRDLEDVFNSLGANDILVLPERTQPYIIDSSEGFRAAGVTSVTGRNGQLPIINRYKGIRGARTWFAMARARRGVIGMGPGAVIQMSQSSWRQERQIEDKGSVQSDGWVSPGRFYIKTDGTSGGELVGSQEKMMEAESAQAFFGNFRMKGRDLGGVAYNGISANGGTFVRLDLSGGWRGFQPVPNGETGAITTGGRDRVYLISKCILGTRDDTGKRVGSSPIMVNSSIGGTIEDTDASEDVAGMLTIWNSSGKHTLKNVNTRFNWGPGINLEKVQSNFELEWLGGSIWSDYQGNGGKTPKPSDQGTQGDLHLNINTQGTSAKITLRGVDLDRGPTPGALNVQFYGSANQQKASDITAFDAQGNPIPIKVYQ